MEEKNIEQLRHSASHILADAVKRLYPETKLGIGPAIKDGFYYDFDREESFTPEDLKKIEKEMRKISAEKAPFVKEEISIDQAKKMFKDKGETYKLELIEGLKDEKISIYKHGNFVDLCKGPHVENTKDVKHFKLLSLAGAYWKGIETNPMLQRAYGTAFFTKEELDKYIKLQEELKKRDHRILGKELELFSFNEEAGPGLVIYHPKGAFLRNIVEDYIKQEHFKRDYLFVKGPHMLKSDIWQRSGHSDFYRENMYFFKVDKNEYAIRPMNCPNHMIVYKSKKRSYRDLPLKLFELGDVYRHEKSGVLHGLFRARGFTQDDAHIFCLDSQVEDEIVKIMDFVTDTLKVFGFKDFSMELSTRPKESIGNDRDWEQATAALKNVMDKKHLAYQINEGEGAFYGPKIDIKLKDVFGREWQCATIQCDFSLPERFNLLYTDKDGKEKKPIMLHRVILGSVERFLGILIEHYGGLFPLWLCPVQVEIISITDSQLDYAKSICDKLVSKGIRAQVDTRSEKMQRKIRDAEKAKIPYMIVVGQKEKDDNKISVRSKLKGNLGIKEPDEFISELEREIADKAIPEQNI